MTTLALILLELSPLLVFNLDFLSSTLWVIFIILGKNVEQDETECYTGNSTLVFLLLELSPLLGFEFDFVFAMLLEYPS